MTIYATWHICTHLARKGKDPLKNCLCCSSFLFFFFFFFFCIYHTYLLTSMCGTEGQLTYFWCFVTHFCANTKSSFFSLNRALNFRTAYFFSSILRNFNFFELFFYPSPKRYHNFMPATKQNIEISSQECKKIYWTVAVCCALEATPRTKMCKQDRSIHGYSPFSWCI